MLNTGLFLAVSFTMGITNVTSLRTCGPLQIVLHFGLLLLLLLLLISFMQSIFNCVPKTVHFFLGT